MIRFVQQVLFEGSQLPQETKYDDSHDFMAATTNNQDPEDVTWMQGLAWDALVIEWSGHCVKQISNKCKHETSQWGLHDWIHHGTCWPSLWWPSDGALWKRWPWSVLDIEDPTSSKAKNNTWSSCQWQWHMALTWHRYDNDTNRVVNDQVRKVWHELKSHNSGNYMSSVSVNVSHRPIISIINDWSQPEKLLNWQLQVFDTGSCFPLSTEPQSWKRAASGNTILQVASKPNMPRTSIRWTHSKQNLHKREHNNSNNQNSNLTQWPFKVTVLCATSGHSGEVDWAKTGKRPGMSLTNFGECPWLFELYYCCLLSMTSL